MDHLQELSFALTAFAQSKAKTDALPILTSGEVRIPLVANLREDAVEVAEELLNCRAEIATLDSDRAKAEANLIAVVNRLGFCVTVQYEGLANEFSEALDYLRLCNERLQAAKTALLDNILNAK